MQYGFGFLGTLFALVSGFYLYSSTQIPITVPGGAPGHEEVVNLGLMHLQSGSIELGIGAAIVAAIFYSAAGIVAVLKERPAE